MRSRQKYRMRTPSTGREVIIEAEPDQVYVDRETGEPLEVVGELIPLAPTPSELPWTVDNLRFCNWCDQLSRKDLRTTARSAAGAWRRSTPAGGFRTPARRLPRQGRVRPLAAVVAAVAVMGFVAACGGGGSSAGNTAGAPPFTVPTSGSSDASLPDQLDDELECLLHDHEHRVPPPRHRDRHRDERPQPVTATSAVGLDDATSGRQRDRRHR